MSLHGGLEDTVTADIVPLRSEAPICLGDLVEKRFVIQGELGHGSFAKVFLACDLHAVPPHHVALKMLHPEWVDGDGATLRELQHELAVLQRIHAVTMVANVVGVEEHEVLLHRGRPFLVLEFVEGCSLRKWMNEQPVVPWERARATARGIARGLAAVHAAQAMHSDLKPENIVMRNGREPVIVDLGGAVTPASANTSKRVCSDRYAAPEQQQPGAEIGPAADVYAFGLIYHEMLTGRLPDEVPRAWPICLRRDGQLIRRCLAQNPLKRPTADELVRRLQSPSPARFPIRSWALVPAAAIVVFLLLSLATLRKPALVAEIGIADRVPTPEYAICFGDENSQRVQGLAVDRQGNTWMVGQFQGTLDFHGRSIGSAGGTDIFVAKFDKDGHALWARPIGDDKEQTVAQVAIDADGNAFVTGRFQGVVDVGRWRFEAASGVHGDGFVAKLDANGTVQWAMSFGGGGVTSASPIAVDPEGNAVFAAHIADGKTMVCGRIQRPSVGDQDLFLVKLNAKGQCLWVESLGVANDSGYKRAQDVDIDAAANILLIGDFSGKISLQRVHEGQGHSDVFVGKFSRDGRRVWSKRFGVDTPELGIAIKALDSVVAIAGTYDKVTEFDSVKLKSADREDVFLVGLNPANGEPKWSKTFGGKGADGPSNLSAIGDNILLTGTFFRTIDLGDGRVFSNEEPAGSSFLARFDSEGRQQGVRVFPRVGYSRVAASQNRIQIAGNFAGQIHLPGLLGTHNSAGDMDIFLAHIRTLP